MKCTLFIFILEYSFPKGNAIYVHRHWNCNTGIIIFASLEMASHYIPASLGSWQCSSLAHLSGPSDHLPQGGRHAKKPARKRDSCANDCPEATGISPPCGLFTSMFSLVVALHPEALGGSSSGKNGV